MEPDPRPLEDRLVEIYHAGLPFRPMIEAVLAELGTSLGWQAAVLWVPDHHHRALVCAGAWGEGPRQARFVAETEQAAFAVGEGMVGRCWRTGRPLWVDDVSREHGFLRRRLVLDSGLQAVCMTPVLDEAGAALGVLELLGVGGGNEERSQLELAGAALSDLADLLATNLEAERTRRQQSRLELALRAGRMGTWEWDRRTGQVVWSPTMERIFGYEPGAFDSSYERYLSHLHPEERAETIAQISEAMERCHEHHVVHRIVRTDGGIRWIEGHGRPVVDDDGRAVGMTGVAMDVTEREDLLADLAHQVRLTEEALTERSEVADLLARSLLPDELPTVDAIELASAFRPGAEIVGGDFYHAFCDDEDLWVVLGDVCGKGAPAASLTGLTRYAIRGMVAAEVLDPAEILRRLNAVILSEDHDRRFVTLVVARVVVTDGRVVVTLARGGHPLPVLRTADGATAFLARRPGALVGALADVVHESQQIELSPGDALVLYTDGVTEASDGSEMFGDERLLATVAGTGSSARAVCEDLLHAVARFDDGRSPDDVAVLVLRVRDLPWSS